VEGFLRRFIIKNKNRKFCLIFIIGREKLFKTTNKLSWAIVFYIELISCNKFLLFQIMNTTDHFNLSPPRTNGYFQLSENILLRNVFFA